MVPVVKPKGKVRICVDLRILNEAVKRERYTLPTLEDVTQMLAEAKVFSKLLFTGHKPLLSQINRQDFDKVALRCQRLLMRLMRFKAKAEHVPGKQLVISDTLSRIPLSGQSSDTEEVIKTFVDTANIAPEDGRDQL